MRASDPVLGRGYPGRRRPLSMVVGYGRIAALRGAPPAPVSRPAARCGHPLGTGLWGSRPALVPWCGRHGSAVAPLPRLAPARGIVARRPAALAARGKMVQTAHWN